MKIQLSDHFTYGKLFRFCIAPVGMMVFTSIYGVVDGFFVSNFVGKTPFAAINLIWPFIMILGSVGFMIGSGGSALVAKTLGEGDQARASRYFTMCVTLTAALGVLLSAVGVALIRPISLWLGATEAMLEDCVVYGRIVLTFNTVFMLQNVFQTFLTTAEKPRLGLAITVAAGLTNMALDALLVAVVPLGVVGAALATGISQCVGGLLPLWYFLRKNNSALRLVKTKWERKPLAQACLNGSSEMMSNVSGSIVSMVYNVQLLRFAGENGVAAYGVLMYIQFIFVAIFIGYSIAAAPVVSYHYGAGNHAELKNLRQKSLTMMGIAGVGLLALAELLAEPLAAIFVGYDQTLYEMTVRAFRIFSIAFLAGGINIFASSFFTALNNGPISAAISFLRTLVFQIGCVLGLPLLLGLDGIWWATTAAEALALIVAAAFLVAERKRYHY